MIGLGAVGGFCLVVGLWLFMKKNVPKITTLMFLIGGLGISGFLGTLAARWVELALGLVSSSAMRLLGLGGIVAGLVVVLTLEVVWKGLWFRKAQVKRYHPWLALILPTVIVATGLPWLSDALAMFREVTSSVGGQVG